jgi:hypothetical protein
MATGNYFDSNRTITKHFQIETHFRLSFQTSLEKTEYYYNISVGSINGTTENTGWHRPFRFENVKKGNILQIPLWQRSVYYTRSQKRQDLWVLNWKSSYDVMLFIYQSHEQHFAEFLFNKWVTMFFKTRGLFSVISHRRAKPWDER